MSNVPVIMIAAAPSPGSLDPAIIRPGRLDIHCTLPSSHPLHFMANVLTEQIIQFTNQMDVTLIIPTIKFLIDSNNINESESNAIVEESVTREVLEESILH